MTGCTLLNGKKPKTKFSLRFLLAFCLGIGLLCALRWYSLSLASFVIVLLHFVLHLAGAAVADRFPAGRSSFVRRGFARLRDANHGPIVLTMCYLVFFYLWRMPLLVGVTPVGIRMLWCTPFLDGLSLATIEHCVLILFHIYLYAGYFGDCYGTGYVSIWNCGMTACLSVLLIASHFAIPWA